jgi:C-terminal peptidase prc
MDRTAARPWTLLTLLLTAAAPGCSASEEGLAPIADCSNSVKNERFLGLMKDVYLWYDKIPAVDPAAYASPSELLEAIRYTERDHWSYIADRVAVDAYYQQGKTLGIGVRWKHDSENALRVAIVYAGSPAAEAGLQRGDEVMEINGATIADIDANELWSTITGEDAEGVEVTLKTRKVDGAEADLVVRKGWYPLPSVTAQEVLDAGGKKVGYLAVDRFIGPTGAALTEAFATFKEEAIEDLVIDLRYNGGGLTETARYLGSLIGGKEVDGRTYNLVLYNNRHRSWDTTMRFAVSEHAITLSRVAIIATGATASASEMLINGLLPWLDVAVIGDTTYGKPVGMQSFDDCDITITPIMFRTLNADGQGGFFDGLPVDCPAEDLMTAPLGDPSEASLAEALHWLETGSCSAMPQGPAPSRVRSHEPNHLPGLRGEIGAF